MSLYSPISNCKHCVVDVPSWVDDLLRPEAWIQSFCWPKHDAKESEYEHKPWCQRCPKSKNPRRFHNFLVTNVDDPAKQLTDMSVEQSEHEKMYTIPNDSTFLWQYIMQKDQKLERDRQSKVSSAHAHSKGMTQIWRTYSKRPLLMILLHKSQGPLFFYLITSDSPCRGRGEFSRTETRIKYKTFIEIKSTERIQSKSS